MSEKKQVTAIRTNALFGEVESKRMTKEDRLSFIDYLFDMIPKLSFKSKKDLSKKVAKQYREEHPEHKLNECWVYRLLLGGIYRDEDGNYGFENITVSVDEACEKPMILEKLGK